MVSSSRRSSARSRSAELGCGEKGVLGERVWIITSRLLFLPPAHPQCSDGVQGSGACLCFPDYKGIACHICSTNQCCGKCDLRDPQHKFLIWNIKGAAIVGSARFISFLIFSKNDPVYHRTVPAMTITLPATIPSRRRYWSVPSLSFMKIRPPSIAKTG